MEPNISGLMSFQSNSPHSIIILRAFAPIFGICMCLANSPPFTYGNCFIMDRVSEFLKSQSIILNATSKYSDKSLPSGFVYCFIDAENRFSSNIPVSSAKKQKRRRVIKIFKSCKSASLLNSLYARSSSCSLASFSAAFTSAGLSST